MCTPWLVVCDCHAFSVCEPGCKTPSGSSSPGLDEDEANEKRGDQCNSRLLFKATSLSGAKLCSRAFSCISCHTNPASHNLATAVLQANDFYKAEQFFCQSSDQMTLNATAECGTSRDNSIVFSAITIDITAAEQAYQR